MNATRCGRDPKYVHPSSINDVLTHAVACSELAQALLWIVHLVKTSIWIEKQTNWLIYQVNRQTLAERVLKHIALRTFLWKDNAISNSHGVRRAACVIARVMPGIRRAIQRGRALSMFTTLASVKLYRCRRCYDITVIEQTQANQHCELPLYVPCSCCEWI